MKKLLIIGASGFGREVFIWARDNPDCGRIWEIAGFLDTRTGLLDNMVRDANALPNAAAFSPEVRAFFNRDFNIVGDPMTYIPQPDDVFLCAVGEPRARRKYASPILEKGGQFITLIHPKAQVSVFVSVGQGSIVGPLASISPDVRIGDFVTINSYTAIAHDAQIGDWSAIDGHCLVAGRARIGEASQIHGGAIITPDARVGDRAVVGAGSVLFGRVPNDVTVLGNPARKFDWRSPNEREE